MIVMKDVNVSVEHIKDGYEDYPREQFELLKPILQVLINDYIKKGIIPVVGDDFFLSTNDEDGIYTVKERLFYHENIVLWVDDYNGYMSENENE